MKKKGKSSLFDGWDCAPNIVTYARIVLSILFIGLYLYAGPLGEKSVGVRWAAFVVFVVAAATDKLDGWMARKYHQVTELGKLLDPIADKLLMLGALIIAAVFEEITWWISLLFVLREVAITIIRFYVVHKNGKVIAASSAGKYKTLTQAIALGMIILPVLIICIRSADAELPNWVVSYYAVAYGLLGISLGLALYSAAIYVYEAFFKKNTARSKASSTNSDSEQLEDKPASPRRIVTTNHSE